MSGERERLTAALAAVDEASSQVGRVHVVDGCGFCFLGDQLEMLGGDPARVPLDLVLRFAAKEPDHWSDTQYSTLWRGLAPRIIRAAAESPGAMTLSDVLRGPATANARFTDWPDHQQQALSEAYAALLCVAVVDWEPHEVADLLGPLAQLHDSLTSWLAEIDAMTGPAAEAGLVRLTSHLAEEVAAYGTLLPWHWYPPDRLGLLSAWLTSSAVADRLHSFAERHPGCVSGSGALLRIEAMQAGANPGAVDFDDCEHCRIQR